MEKHASSNLHSRDNGLPRFRLRDQRSLTYIFKERYCCTFKTLKNKTLSLVKGIRHAPQYFGERSSRQTVALSFVFLYKNFLFTFDFFFFLRNYILTLFTFFFSCDVNIYIYIYIFKKNYLILYNLSFLMIVLKNFIKMLRYLHTIKAHKL